VSSKVCVVVGEKSWRLVVLRCSIFVVLAVFELFKDMSFAIGIYIGKCIKERKEEVGI